MKKFLIVSVVALLAVSCKPTKQEAVNTMPPTQQSNNTNQTSTVITYSGEWVQTPFAQAQNYYHSVNFMVPATWKLNCCNDTEGYSAHSVYPTASVNNLETSPQITLYDYVLATCPGGEYTGCSIEEWQKVTADQYMTSLTKYLEKESKAIGFGSLKKTGTVKLDNFVNNAVVYSGATRSNQPVDFYLFRSPKGVVGVAFEQPGRFDSSLTKEFLNKITPN